MRYGVIDIGTSSLKAYIYDETLRGTPIERVRSRYVAEGRYIEQDPRYIWGFIEHCAKRFSNLGVRRMGIATYRASIISWDRRGEPLTNIITWLDPRGREIYSGFRYRVYSKLPLIGKIIRPETPVLKILWLLKNNPEIHDKVGKGEAFIGTLSSYIAYRLSRKYINDLSNEALTGLIHPKTLKRIGILYTLLDIPDNVGAEIIDNVDEIGSLGGVDVNALIADQQASIIGSSCINPGCVKITCGTGIFIDAPTDRFIIPSKGMIPIVVYKIKQHILYGVETFMSNGGNVVDWLVDVGLLDDPGSLDEYIAKARSPVYFIPSLGEMTSPVRRGSSSGLIYGLSRNTSRFDIVRGVIEGLAHMVCYSVRSIARYIGAVKTVRIDGGLSNSVEYIKILSTSCGTAIERVRGGDATSRGVAILLSLYDGLVKLNDIGGLADVDLKIHPGDREILVDRDKLMRVLGWKL